MRIAVIGTGMVGRALGAGLTELGHDVVVGTRDPEATRAREEWHGVPLTLMPFEDVATGADLVVNATSGQESVAALRLVGAEPLSGKILVDVANPLDFSSGFPPTLSVKDTDSLAEQIQRELPATRVVKTLNTVNAHLMLHPGDLPDGSSMFVAGDDPEARRVVAGLLAEAGWRDVIEFDSLAAARGMEMWLPLWVQLMGSLGTAAFNLKIVR